MNYAKTPHILIICLTLFFSGCFRHPHLETVDRVELTEIEDSWYVPHHILITEKGKLAPIDSYTLREDGRIDVRYRFRLIPLMLQKKRGTVMRGLSIRSPTRIGKYNWPFKTFMIIDKDPDCMWMVVGHPSRDMLWI